MLVDAHKCRNKKKIDDPLFLSKPPSDLYKLSDFLQIARACHGCILIKYELGHGP